MAIPRKKYIAMLNEALEDRDTIRFLFYLGQMVLHTHNYPKILENAKVSYKSVRAAMLGLEVLTKEDTVRLIAELNLELISTKGDSDE